MKNPIRCYIFHPGFDDLLIHDLFGFSDESNCQCSIYQEVFRFVIIAKHIAYAGTFRWSIRPPNLLRRVHVKLGLPLFLSPPRSFDC